MTRCLLSLVLLTGSLGAQTTIQVYPGGSSAAFGPFNSIPFSASLAADIRYQLCIPGPDIPTGPAVLTGVGFAPLVGGTLVIPNLIFSVGHKSPGPLSCNMPSNSNDLTQQYSGAHTFQFNAGMWNAFGVPMSFAYNGLDGLILEFRMQNTVGGMSFLNADVGTAVQRVYNRNFGGFNATTCSHPISEGLKVELTFTVSPNSAQVNVLGTGCSGSNGTVTLGGGGVPFIGNTSFTLDVTQAASSSLVWMYTAPFPSSPPFPLGPGCNLYLDFVSMFNTVLAGNSPLGPLVSDTGGSVSFPLPVPGNPGFAGATFYFQAAVVDPGSALGFTLSNGVETVIF